MYFVRFNNFNNVNIFVSYEYKQKSFAKKKQLKINDYYIFVEVMLL